MSYLKCKYVAISTSCQTIQSMYQCEKDGIFTLKVLSGNIRAENRIQRERSSTERRRQVTRSDRGKATIYWFKVLQSHYCKRIF